MGHYDELPKAAGIYGIRNLIDGKMYVGQAQVLSCQKGVYDRCKAHYGLLQRGKDTRHLQHAWDKYGSDAFVFEVLMLCANEECCENEENLIRELRTWERSHGYNLDKRARGAGAKTRETIERMHSPEGRRKRSIAMKGRRKITNGTENRWYVETEGMPENFWFGFTIRHPSRWKNPGFTTAFDTKTGENLYVSVTDPRYVSGEILHIANKRRWSGIATKQDKKKAEHAIFGKNVDRAKGSKWINDGKRNKRVPREASLPMGWSEGRMKSARLGRNQFS
jgi:hypothetical protein